MAKAPIAFPFYTLHESSLEVSNWRLVVGDQKTSELELKNDWSPGRRITIERDVSIPDWNKVKENLGLNGNVTLGFSVKIGTGKPTLPWIVDSFSEVIDSNKQSITLRREIDSPMLIGWLHVFSSINFLHAEKNLKNSRVAPKNKGDRLWNDGYRYDLDDSTDAFPITITPFSKLRIGMRRYDSPWYVHWSPGDWSKDYSAAIRIYVNEEQKSFTQKFLQGDVFAMQMVMSDVISQICQSIVLSEENIDEEFFSDGTLGQKGFFWIRQIWGDISLARLKANLLEEPSKFRAACIAFAAFEIEENVDE